MHGSENAIEVDQIPGTTGNRLASPQRISEDWLNKKFAERGQAGRGEAQGWFVRRTFPKSCAGFRRRTWKIHGVSHNPNRLNLLPWRRQYNHRRLLGVGGERVRCRASRPGLRRGIKFPALQGSSPRMAGRGSSPLGLIAAVGGAASGGGWSPAIPPPSTASPSPSSGGTEINHRRPTRTVGAPRRRVREGRWKSRPRRRGVRRRRNSDIAENRTLGRAYISRSCTGGGQLAGAPSRVWGSLGKMDA